MPEGSYAEIPWYEREGRDLAQTVCDIADELWKEQAPARTRAQRALELYEGRRLPGLAARAYYSAGTYQAEYFEQLYWNIPRSLVHTVQAKIAARQQPKPQFMVTEGDWGTKRKARKLDRFVEAQLHQPQGGVYENAWELTQDIFVDAAVWGSGFIKVTADVDERQVVLERVFPWELLVDPEEARYGSALSRFHRYPYDMAKLIARYPEHAATIRASEPAQDEENQQRADARVSEKRWVYEAWYTGTKPGKHVVAVREGLLVEDEDEFSFVRLAWCRERLGMGTTSLLEEVEPVSDEVNATLHRMQEGERKAANAIILAHENSLVNPEEIQSNEIATVVLWSGDHPPTFQAPQGYSQSTLDWLKMQVEQMYDLPGVSRMSATSRKEPGITAGVALRTMSDIETERFAVIYRAYEQLFVSLARRIVAATRELAAEHKDFTVQWPGGTFLREIAWSEVDLPDEQYTVRVAAVSGMKNTPGDRLQLAQDLLGMNLLQPESFAQVALYLDTPGELGKTTKQREWINRQIERWLDAEDGDEFQFQGPIKFGDVSDALLQVAEAYFDALLEDAPEYNKRYFVQWLEQCDRILQERAALQQQLQAENVGPMPNMAGAPTAAGPAPATMAAA